MYYENTIAAIRKAAEERFADPYPDEKGLETGNIGGYALWMLKKIEEMDTQSFHEALKAARWLGWALRVVEQDLQLWDNMKSRELVRSDVQAGNDRPKEGKR